MRLVIGERRMARERNEKRWRCGESISASAAHDFMRQTIAPRHHHHHPSPFASSPFPSHFFFLSRSFHHPNWVSFPLHGSHGHSAIFVRVRVFPWRCDELVLCLISAGECHKSWSSDTLQCRKRNPSPIPGKKRLETGEKVRGIYPASQN